MLWPDAGSRGAASLHLALPSGARAWPRHRGVQHHRAPSSSRSNGVSIRVTGGSSGSSLATHQRHRHARLLLLRRVRQRAREAGVSSGRGRQGGRGAAAAGGRGGGEPAAGAVRRSGGPGAELGGRHPLEERAQHDHDAEAALVDHDHPEVRTA